MASDAQDSPQRERILWLTVIKQAQWDAEGRGEVEPRFIYRARRWLTNPLERPWLRRSFLTVCSLAGMPETQAQYLQEAERKKWPKS